MQNQVELPFVSEGRLGTNGVIMIQPNPCLWSKGEEKKAAGFGLALFASLRAPGIDSVRTVPPMPGEQEGRSPLGVICRLMTVL